MSGARLTTTYSIYTITHRTTGKTYVGRTSRKPEVRWKEYLREAKLNQGSPRWVSWRIIPARESAERAPPSRPTIAPRIPALDDGNLRLTLAQPGGLLGGLLRSSWGRALILRRPRLFESSDASIDGYLQPDLLSRLLQQRLLLRQQRHPDDRRAFFLSHDLVYEHEVVYLVSWRYPFIGHRKFLSRIR